PDNAQVLGATLAFGGPALRFGWTTEWTGGDLGSPGRNDHRLGLASRATRWLSLGATVDHPFQPHGARRVYTVGAALRPLGVSFANGGGTDESRLTVFADAVMPEGGVDFYDRTQTVAQWRIGGEVEIVEGLALRGSVETDGGVGNIGVVFR